MRVLISISDPWEFGESLGWKALSGNVTEIGDEQLLVKLDKPLFQGGRSYRFVMAIPRHEGTTFKKVPRESAVACSFTCVNDDPGMSSAVSSADSWRGGLAFIGAIALNS